MSKKIELNCSYEDFENKVIVDKAGHLLELCEKWSEVRSGHRLELSPLDLEMINKFMEE